MDDTEAARAEEYALLATLLARAPDQQLLNRLAALPGDATPLGLAHTALAEAASGTNAEPILLASQLGGSDAETCCLMARITRPDFCTSDRWHGCANFLDGWQSNVHRVKLSRRITPRRFARSWQG